MKISFKIIFTLISFCIILNITSCGNKKDESPEIIELPHYSQVTALESKDAAVDLFKIENRNLYKIGAVENLINLVYNLSKKIYVYSINVSKGANFNYNRLQVFYDGKKVEINNFYAAIDLKLNFQGDKIAFRTYKSDSLDSAEGMKIYDIKNSKYISLKSKVLVSGNLYQWIDTNRIIYYGTIEGQKKSDKIYEYDFNTNKESVYLQDIDGYCMYFIPMNQNLLFLAKQGDKSVLYYYDKDSKNIKNIESSISNIYDSVVNYENGDIYFIGDQNGKDTALYRFSSRNFKLDRLTYDFPKVLDETAGIAMGKDGNVYFCGLENPDEKYKKDIFTYDIKESSINLISTHEGNYSVYSNIK